MQIVNSKLKYFSMIIFGVFSDFSTVESEFCIEEKYGIKLALVSISYVTILLNLKEQPFCFIKKVVPFNFGFDSLGNE